MRVLFTFSLEAALKQHLENVAKARQRSVSSLINGLLTSHLSQVEKEITTFTDTGAPPPPQTTGDNPAPSTPTAIAPLPNTSSGSNS